MMLVGLGAVCLERNNRMKVDLPTLVSPINPILIVSPIFIIFIYKSSQMGYTLVGFM